MYLEFGKTYTRLADPQNALAAFERGSRLDVNADLLERLAEAYQQAGDLRKSATALVEAMAMDSSRYALAPQLVELYTKIDPGGCAVNRQGGEPSLNLNCPLVHGDICAASRNAIASFTRTGQSYESADIRRTAVEDRLRAGVAEIAVSRITWNPNQMAGQPCVRGMRLAGTAGRSTGANVTFAAANLEDSGTESGAA